MELRYTKIVNYKKIIKNQMNLQMESNKLKVSFAYYLC